MAFKGKSYHRIAVSFPAHMISMVECKTIIYPVRWQGRYYSLTLSHGYNGRIKIWLRKHGCTYPLQILSRHDRKTFSAMVALCVGITWVTGGFPWQRSSCSLDLVFSLLSSWRNCWTNNRVARVLRHHDAFVTQRMGTQENVIAHSHLIQDVITCMIKLV